MRYFLVNYLENANFDCKPVENKLSENDLIEKALVENERLDGVKGSLRKLNLGVCACCKQVRDIPRDTEWKSKKATALKSELKAGSKNSILDFIARQEEKSRQKEEAEIAEEFSVDVDAIFEPRKNLKKLKRMDPIEKEIEEFKLFCARNVPISPRLKLPLLSLNLFPN